MRSIQIVLAGIAAAFLLGGCYGHSYNSGSGPSGPYDSSYNRAHKARKMNSGISGDRGSGFQNRSGGPSSGGGFQMRKDVH